jgi:bacillolysin
MARKSLYLSLMAGLTGLALLAQTPAQAQGALSRQSEAIARLAAETGNRSQVSIHSATGAARFVRVTAGGKLGSQRGAVAVGDGAKMAASAQFVTEYAGLFGISNVAAELGAPRIDKDRHGGTRLTYKQVYQGLPVFGAELKTHFDAADNLTVVNGNFIPGINLDVSPSRSAEAAAATALSLVKGELGKAALLSAKISTATPKLMVYRENLAKGVEGANHLAWMVEVGNRSDVREFVYVDAHSGKVIDKITGIHEAKNRRAFDSQGATAPGPNYPGTPFWVEGQPFPTGNTEADNMISASSEIYDLFKKAFGRDSYDGNGATMDSIFNRGNGCPNASWNGSFISFCPGTTTDDITAHEWGHAYTEYTDNLIYAWQPGALNEAYSDIWGETVDRLNGRGTDTPDAARTLACTAFTANPPSVIINAPVSIAGPRVGGSASFGPATFSIAGTAVMVVNDGAGASSTDGCETPFVNAAAVSGKIAFIDRGNCAFSVKTKNAQLNGAIGVIIGNNAPGAAPGMSGTDASITIPTLSVTQGDGTLIKAQVGVATVVASLARGGNGSDNSVRWLMGEDSSGFGGAIRDMYNPTCYGNPGKVTDTQYSCSTADSGGVHGNSGVPNHAYALLVDGGTYNGQNIAAIGLTKAAHMYFRAQSVYQGPSSGFADHADALAQSCTDLTGVNLPSLSTGAPSGELINATDCAQVAKAALAVELRTPPTQCNFQPMLAKSPPPLCAVGTATAVVSDNFDSGKRGGIRWQVSNVGSTGDFTKRDWGVVNTLPDGRAGYGIFATNPNIGTCAAGGDQTGVMRMDSPEITVPAGATTLRFSFDHWMASEVGFDGGNLKISVNGGAWQLVKAADFIYNPYNTTLGTAAAGNTNPMAGEAAFSGADGGSVKGSWGRSIINLSPYASPNDKVKLRFEMGSDGCGGVTGWYLDDVMLYRCTP